MALFLFRTGTCDAKNSWEFFVDAIFCFVKVFPAAGSSTLTIAFKLADVKLESSGAYLLKFGKNLSWDFEVIYIFRKNAVLNICRYLKGFYIYKKTNNIFLKFHHYLFGMSEIIEIGWIFHSKKRESKT